jgi:hypothetical protein
MRTTAAMICGTLALASCATAPPPPDGGARQAEAQGGVVIDGKRLARDQVVVFLHIGHSTMAGRSDTPASLRPFNYETHPHLWAYAAHGAWRLAREPLSPDSMTGSWAGPGMSILRTALALAPDRYMVSIGRGQSGLKGGVCRNFRKGRPLYDLVMGPAMELKGRVTFGGIFAMFGLSEVNDLANAGRFGECLEGLAREMRADLGEPALPFIVGDWEVGARAGVGPDSEAGRIIIPQIRVLPTRIPRSAVVPTEGLSINPADEHHLDMAGNKEWVERAFGLMKANGWIPWAR